MLAEPPGVAKRIPRESAEQRQEFMGSDGADRRDTAATFHSPEGVTRFRTYVHSYVSSYVPPYVRHVPPYVLITRGLVTTWTTAEPTK